MFDEEDRCTMCGHFLKEYDSVKEHQGKKVCEDCWRKLNTKPQPVQLPYKPS